MVFRSVSRPTLTWCLLLKYSLASVGPKPRYTSCDRIRTICSRFACDVFRCDGRPRRPWITALSPFFRMARSNRFTWRALIPSSCAACDCLISFLRAFFSVPLGHGENSTFVHLPSLTLSRGHFYLAQRGHSHVAPTVNHVPVEIVVRPKVRPTVLLFDL